jgi:hypothetical protein
MQFMRTAYKSLAYAIDALILLQAAAIAWAVFGLSKWIEDGNTLSKSVMEGEKTPFTEANGFAIHGISGTMVIPLVALVLFGISFFAKVPEGVKWASMILVGIILQVVLGIAAHSVPALGFLHGFWALLLFWLAWRAARQADVVEVTRPAAEDVPAR